MKRFMALLVMSIMVLSAVGAASAATVGQVYEICGSTNPDATGNVADIANSGVAFSAIGAVYPDAKITSGTESLITDAVKQQGGTWIILIGREVANSITKELIDAGKVSATLNGYQKVLNAWGANTANVMVIAGADRFETQAACAKYAADLRAGVEGALLTGAVGPTRTFLLDEPRTVIWQTELMNDDLVADGEGTVVSENEDIEIDTEGTIEGGWGTDIEVKDFKQKSGKQQISYAGKLEVQPDYTVEGTLTGTFTGPTPFGEMQSGVVTMEANDWEPVVKRLYDFTIDNGTYTVTIDDDVALEPGIWTTIVHLNGGSPDEVHATLNGNYANWITVFGTDEISLKARLETNNRLTLYFADLTPSPDTVWIDATAQFGPGMTFPGSGGSGIWVTSGLATNELGFEGDGIHFDGDISGNVV